MGKGVFSGMTWRPGVSQTGGSKPPETHLREEGVATTHQQDRLTRAVPQPLAPGHADMAARLRALAPKRMSVQERRTAFCELLHRIDCDPAVRAIAEQIADFHAPAQEYVLNDHIVITEAGARLIYGMERLSAEALMVRSDASFVLRAIAQGDFSSDNLARMEANITARVEAISDDLIGYFRQLAVRE